MCHSSHTGILAICVVFAILAMTTPSAVTELLEKLAKAQESTQKQLADLQRAVTDAQAEVTKKVVQKLDEERGFQFKKTGNKKQFCFNQTIAYHIDTAKEELTKINKGSINPATAKLLETAERDSQAFGEEKKPTKAGQVRSRWWE